jgi:hypothetical protein
MGLLTVVSALSLLGAAHAEFNIVRHVAPAPRAKEAAALPPAEFSVPFTAKTPRRSSKKGALAALRGKPTKKIPGKKALGAGGSTVAVDGSDFDDEYLTNVTIGGQHFSLIIDTGRSVSMSLHNILSADIRIRPARTPGSRRRALTALTSTGILYRPTPAPLVRRAWTLQHRRHSSHSPT